MLEKTVLKILSDAASGLAYLHSIGVVHGAVKPSNILVCSIPKNTHCFFIILKHQELCISRMIGIFKFLSCSDGIHVLHIGTLQPLSDYIPVNCESIISE